VSTPLARALQDFNHMIGKEDALFDLSQRTPCPVNYPEAQVEPFHTL